MWEVRRKKLLRVPGYEFAFGLIRVPGHPSDFALLLLRAQGAMFRSPDFCLQSSLSSFLFANDY